MRLPSAWPRDLWVALGCYLLFYALYRSGVWVVFDAADIVYYTHYLNPRWLREDLGGSLLYLHSQPPLMSVLIGVIFKLSEAHHRLLLEALHLAAGVAAVAFLHVTLARLAIDRRVRLAVMLALCSFPTLFRYQAWFYSTHLEFFLCTVVMFLLASLFVHPPRRRFYLTWLFCLATALGLMRGQWHLVLWLGLAVVLALLVQAGGRRTVLSVAVICLLPLAGWYTKNLAVFGFWGPSSWLGANLAQVAVQLVTPQELRDLKARGVIAPDFPADFVMEDIFRRVPPETVADLPHVSLGPSKVSEEEWEMLQDRQSVTRHPYSDLRQYNYLGVLVSARQDLRDALAIIARHPLRYAEQVLYSMWIAPSFPTLTYYSESMTDIVGWVPDWLEYWLIAGSVLLYGCVPYIVLLLGRQRLGDAQWRFYLCSLYLTFAMLAIGCAFNGFEHERMRWGVAPAYLCQLALLLDMMLNTRRRRGAAA